MRHNLLLELVLMRVFACDSLALFLCVYQFANEAGKIDIHKVIDRL